MILHWYFARRFALAFSYVLGGFLILVALLDFIEQMRRFRGLDDHAWPKSAVGGAQCAGHTLSNAPVGHRIVFNHVVFELGAQQ